MPEALVGAIALVFDWQVLAVILMAAFYGAFVGSVPGLTATMSVALLVPLTFFMDPVPAIAAIVTTTATAIFAGDIPGALLRIPGTPASAAYVGEAYAMTQKGQAELALGTSLVTAVIGGLIGTVVLMLVAPELARFAIQFSSVEYFWLASLGLTCAVLISGGSVAKSLASLMIGLLIATIGIDVAVGYPRFTFGQIELLDGVSFIPAMIGMFAVAEILRNVARGPRVGRPKDQNLAAVFKGLGQVLSNFRWGVLRGSALGSVVGALPGAGADIAAWISYTLAKRFSKTPEKFGTGHPEGIAEAGASNNAAVAGAWTPALCFGIPGDTVTAIAIGILFLKGLQPGPLVFTQQPDLVYAVFVAFMVANLVLLPVGFIAIRSARYVLKVPASVLMPVILVFCMVGAFAMTNSVFAIWIMLALGVLAFFMEENGFPVAPAILGIVLGPMVEDNFMVTMLKYQGDLTGFFDRPIATVLGVFTLTVWTLLLLRYLNEQRAHRPSKGSLHAPR
ncbi:MAG: C4-dicarboxylate ABC transporter permease [Geminicoccaceae bacterium]|nr:MAG: C4-dicarboxylate ABC transporter permease [Geminicoccaceae bacterium]